MSVASPLKGTTGPAPAKTNTYDASGNLLSDGTTSFIYSDRGRRKSSTKGGLTTSYAYNGLGQRVIKTSSNLATGANYYVDDEQGHLISEYDNNFNGIEETVYLGDLPVVVLKQYVNGTGLVTQPYYLYADQINTPRVIISATNNQIVWRWDNADPFGVSAANDNPANLPATPAITYLQPNFVYNLRFAGQYYDKEHNLHYNYYRDYDPQLGRYTESDPIGLKGGINTYGYVGGNPLTRVDPEGLASKPNCNGRDCYDSPYDPTTDGPRPSPTPAPRDKKDNKEYSCADNSPSLGGCLACCASRSAPQYFKSPGSTCSQSCYDKAGVSMSCPTKD